MAFSRRTSTVLKDLLTVLVGVLPGFTIYVWRPAPAYGLYLYMTGRSTDGLMDTIRAVAHSKEISREIVAYWDRCVLRKEEGDYVLLATPGGDFWLPKSCGPWCLMAEQDLNEYGEIRQGDVVLDCGANVGAFSRRALDAGADRVIAIEPSPENLECLRRNLRDGIEKGRVQIVDKGVWDSETVLQFTVDKQNSVENSFVLNPGDSVSVIRVPVTTIDRIVQQLGLPKVDVIKMDIEGSEKQALRGAHHTIISFKPRLGIATEHLPDDETAIPELIRSIRPDYTVQPAGPKIVIPATNRIGTEIMLFR
jgi:FkbM family methyltransferase